MNMLSMETVLRMLKEIEERIQIIAFSDKEKYDNYIKRIQAIKQDLLSLDDRDNTIGEKNRVMEAIGMLDLETKMYIEYGTNFEKNEDITLTLETKGQASGKEKTKQARIQLYKSICEDLKKLEEINLEDIKKIKEQWDIEKDSSLKYSVSEIEQIEEAISDVLLDYYIKYIKKNKAMPEELDLNEYTNVEEFAKRIKERLMEVISQHNVDRFKQLEYFNILNNLSDEEIIDNEKIWEEITGVPVKFEEKHVGLDLLFLKKEQCYGCNKLEIFKKRRLRSLANDFSDILGSCDYSYNLAPEYASPKVGRYWTSTGDGSNKVYIVDEFDSIRSEDVFSRSCGARPALKFSSIDSIPTNGDSGKRVGDGVLEVEYGYYPQEAASKDMQEVLESAYRRKSILRTGNYYTTDSKIINADYEKFAPKQHEEYEYNKKRYVRVEVNAYKQNGHIYPFHTKLSNGERYTSGDIVWVEVQPIKWWVDEEAKIMITEKIMFAGVQFKHTRDYKTEDFDTTFIKQFMDDYWSNEILQVLKQQQLEGKSSDDFEGR